VNEDLDHRTLLRKYERELRRLRAELQQKSKDLVDKRLVLQVCCGPCRHRGREVC
jgi:kinesin family protein 3/17